MVKARRKIWGWGLEGEGPDAKSLAFAEASLGALLGGTPTRREPPELSHVDVAPPRLAAPPSLASILSSEPYERVLRARGRSYRDIARALRGDFDPLPDLVAFPTTEADVARVLDFAAENAVAVIPFGGGTSVSGGVEAVCPADKRGTLTLDLGRMSGVRSLDRESLTAQVWAGTLGPELERQLRTEGLSLRHFPQSFEYSTVGGWIATRAGGHFATQFTHIDDLVESVRVVTPRGSLETRRLPGSSAGPQPERLFLGSEGALGVITQSWLRVFERPRHRAQASVTFATFEQGLHALRAIAQSGLCPSNARLIDGPEALMSAAGAPDRQHLFLAFESASIDVAPLLHAAVELACAAGGERSPDRGQRPDLAAEGRDESADTYRSAFFRAPYLRDELILRGVFVETYETAAPWSKLDQLDSGVRSALTTLDLGPHLLARRITHVYRDGAAPYYTLIARAREGDEDAMWWRVKEAITSAVIDAGGTSTHHHAVGRDVMRWYERERPPLFADALSAIKRELDPAAIMNPGVLLRATTG